jgi:hypothetical protein
MKSPRFKWGYWKRPQPVPRGPYSRNVEVLRFGSRRARAVARQMNGGQHDIHIKMKRGTRCLLWHGCQFYWSTKGFYRGGKDSGRRPLHHLVWETFHGKPIPVDPPTTVIFLDGNKNNFNPRNLALRTRKECALINQRKMGAEVRSLIATKRWSRHGTKSTAILLNRFNRITAP